MTKEIFISENLPAYYAAPDRPVDDGRKYPGIILIHEIWGLTPHIINVADRIAEQGYIVIAPNLFSGMPFEGKVDHRILAEMQDPETRDEAQKKMRDLMAPTKSPEFASETIDKIKDCFSLLMLDEAVMNGNIGIIGFCFGGTYSFAFAAEEPLLKASVSFYGRPPEPLERVSSITCPVLAFYGEQDTGLTEGLPALMEAMEKNHKDFASVVYPNCGHAFFNDMNARMYNKEAASDAWLKMLAFLEENLK